MKQEARSKNQGQKILISTIVSLLFFASFVRADVSGNTFENYSYLFRLYYDNGQIVADRDFQFKYDIVAESYSQPRVATQFPFRGEIINFVGEISASFIFDPREGDSNFTKGKLSVKAPYVPDGEKAVFYDSQDRVALTIYVNESSFCNDDGICNSDRGEDAQSCSKDCRQSLPAPLPDETNNDSGPSGGIISGIVYSVLGLGLLGGLWWVARRRKSAVSTFTPPSTP